MKEFSVVFYQSDLGSEPVRDWLRGLPNDDRRKIGYDLALVQVGWPVGMPLCRSLGRGLWEVRSGLPSSRIARLLFCVHEAQIFIVHGFIKKTQKTPPADMKLAQARMKEILS